MNRHDVSSLLEDLENLISDARDALVSGSESDRLTLVHLANARESLRKVVDSSMVRDSMPPLLASNQPTRTTAAEHFRRARELVAPLAAPNRKQNR